VAEAPVDTVCLPPRVLLVDSHCHLNFPDYKDDLDEVIARARASGVGVMQTICTELAEFDEVLGIANRYDGVYCSIGVHPNDSLRQEPVTAEQLIARTTHPKVIGIGETGLDYHYETAPRELQKQNFLAHIECARQTGLPLIVHTRDADEDTIDILTSEMARGKFRGLIHCFSSSRQLAEKMVDIGLYISIAGIITFKKADEIRDVVRDLPLERILVETDAPFLAPAPHRGKRNEPSYTIYTNKLIAELKSISEDQCATQTTINFFELFNKAKIPDGYLCS
jgi:TatD DNase family protein